MTLHILDRVRLVDEAIRLMPQSSRLWALQNRAFIIRKLKRSGRPELLAALLSWMHQQQKEARR